MAEAAREWNADVKDLGEKIVGLSLLQAKELADYLKEEHGIDVCISWIWTYCKKNSLALTKRHAASLEDGQKSKNNRSGSGR